MLQIDAILIFGSTLSFPLAHAATPIANYSALSAWERLRDEQLTPVENALCHSGKCCPMHTLHDSRKESPAFNGWKCSELKFSIVLHCEMLHFVTL